MQQQMLSPLLPTDEDVRALSQRAAQASDSKNRVAQRGNAYDTRLQKLATGYSEFIGVHAGNLGSA